MEKAFVNIVRKWDNAANLFISAPVYKSLSKILLEKENMLVTKFFFFFAIFFYAL